MSDKSLEQSPIDILSDREAIDGFTNLKTLNQIGNNLNKAGKTPEFIKQAFDTSVEK